MYKIQEVLNSLVLSDLILIMNENKYNEHDCDRDTYINHVVSTMYLNKNHRITVLYAYDELRARHKPIGYLIVRHDSYLCNEITVLDVYITKAYQGMSCIDTLIGDMIPTAFKVGALRIKWNSRTFDTGFWEKRSYGNEIKSYKVFYVELNDDSNKEFNKRRKTE